MTTDKIAAEETATKEPEKTTEKGEETASFKGKYVATIGRRKTSVARVRLYKNGKGAIMVNGKKIGDYFEPDKAGIPKQPLKLSGLLRDFNFSVVVSGGGKMGQAEAVRHGITNALIKVNADLKPGLRAKGWVTRDARKKERKKPGLKRARKAPQWSKR